MTIIGKTLPELVSWLQIHGVKAEIRADDSAGRAQLGIVVDGEFYPDWELGDARNAGYVGTRDFESIRYRREHNWSAVR